MQVLTRDKCPNCNGKPIMQHPLWLKFYSEHGSNTLSQEELREWFCKHYVPTHSDGLPPLDIICNDCEGSGYKEFWMEDKEFYDVFLSQKLKQ